MRVFRWQGNRGRSQIHIILDHNKNPICGTSARDTWRWDEDVRSVKESAVFLTEHGSWALCSRCRASLRKDGLLT